MRRNQSMIALAVATLGMALTLGWTATTQAQSGAPHYEADLSWPKPFPDRWVLGGLGGVCVDAQDHVLILNRQDMLEGDLNAGCQKYSHDGSKLLQQIGKRACSSRTSRSHGNRIQHPTMELSKTVV